MEKGDVTKIAALAVVAAAIAVHLARLATNTPPSTWGVAQQHAPFSARILYSLTHGNILHLAINSYALLAIAFRHTPHPLHLAAAIAAAITIPTCCLSNTPTVGMSAIVCALLGIATVGKQWKQYLLWCGLTIAATAPLHNIATGTHLYTYAAGIAIALLSTPLSWHTTRK